MRRWPSFLVFLLLSFQASAAESAYVRTVTVARDGSAYVCNAVLFAPVPPGLAFDVLTDIDHMADWVPNIRQSRFLSREGNTAHIEQVGLAQFGLLSFNFSTERRLEMYRPTFIKSTQIRGTARRYNSLMRLAPEAAGTRLDYHADFEPGFLAALVFSPEFMEHEIAEQFTAMIAEMVRRKSSVAAD